MKNYPNQASSFERVRGTLNTIKYLNDHGQDPGVNEVLGYEAARRGYYTYRKFDVAAASPAQVNAFFASEKNKPLGDQGAQTFARELRRTLRDLGWIDHHHQITGKGDELLATSPGSVQEQALLVEGLLNIEATFRDESHPHHPVMTMLRLLAHRASTSRQGLELALEPNDDTELEFQRVLQLYKMDPEERQRSLEITDNQRANAVKIFPSLAVYAGLISNDDREYALTPDGWSIIGQSSSQAKRTVGSRPGRRTTTGKQVTPDTAAKVTREGPFKALSAEEQHRALKKLQERTASHQALVKRIATNIGNDNGTLFEDPFSFDLLWIPSSREKPVYLFEMKTITGDADAYARVRSAMAQLRYYDFFHVRHVAGDREIRHIAAFDNPIPTGLVDFLTHEKMGVVISSELTNSSTTYNQAGAEWMAELR